MDLLIGGLAGVISRTITAPLELNKIQGQNSYMPHSTLRATLQKEGITGLWKGNYTNCIRIFPQMAINFAVYNGFQNHISHMLPSYLQDYTHFIGGAFGGAISMSIIYPLENARSRLSLQSKHSHYNGLYDVFKKTPLRTLYNGLRMSIFGFVPYSALNYGFFNLYKGLVAGDPTSVSGIEKLLCGGLAGLSAVSFTYPTDLIRRRLQLQGFDPLVPKYNGIVDCVSKIVKTEGINGLYRGLIPCYMKIFPASGIQFFIFETLRSQRS